MTKKLRYGHKAEPSDDPRVCRICGRSMWRDQWKVWSTDSGYRHSSQKVGERTVEDVA